MNNTDSSNTPKKCLPFGWIVKTSNTYPDRVYYFNTRTNASSWEQPTLVSQTEYLSSIPPDELNKKLQRDQARNIPVPQTPTKNHLKLSQGSSGIGDEEFSPSFNTDSDGQTQSDTDTDEPALTDFQKKILKKEEEDSDLEEIKKESLSFSAAEESKRPNSSQSEILKSERLNEDLKDESPKLKSPISKFGLTETLKVIQSSESETRSNTQKLSRGKKSSSNFSVASALTGKDSDASGSYRPQRWNLRSKSGIKRKFDKDDSTCSVLKLSESSSEAEILSPKTKKKYSPIKFDLESGNKPSKPPENVTKSDKHSPIFKLNHELQVRKGCGDNKSVSRTVIRNNFCDKSDIPTIARHVHQSDESVEKLKIFVQDGADRQIVPVDKRNILSESDLRLKLIKKKGENVQITEENEDLPAPKKQEIQTWINSISDLESVPLYDLPPSPVSKTSSKSDDSGIITNITSNKNKDRRVVLTSDTQAVDSGHSSSNMLSPLPPHIKAPETPVTLDDNEEEEEEEMEIDDEDEEMMIVDLQEVREEVGAIPELAIGKLTKQDSCDGKSLQGSDNYGLFIIIDTNILIQNLKFLQTLSETVLPDFGLPFIVIPWVVMQELDFIKDGKSKHSVSNFTTLKAEKAVKHLFSCLQNKHPRVLGQTALDSRVPVDNFTIECNDDRVLQCCIRYNIKYPNAYIVLLTDDLNLCNKATISDITAFTKNGFFDGIKSLTIKETSQISHHLPSPNTNNLRNNSTPKIQSNNEITPVKKHSSQHDERKLVDEILCDVKEEIKKSLGVVLETEMKEAFNNLWKAIVYRKPPWSALDIMESIQKHWIGVFGLVLDRRKKVIVDDIVNFLRQSTGLKIEELKTLIRNVKEFLDVCATREGYNGVLEESKTKLGKLLLKCEPKTVKFISPAKEIPSPTSEVNTKQQQNEEAEDELLNSVQDRFQIIWSAINDCSDNLSNLENPTSILQLIIPVITELRHQFAVCLSVSPTAISSHRVEFETFTHSLNSFFSKMQAESPKPILTQALVSFFINPSKRETLVLGLEQLDQMICKFHAYVRMM